MPVQDKPTKAVVSVVEMASMLDLSKSRLYALMSNGIFPRPTRHRSCKRPVFDLQLQKKCLDIRRTGIGDNGEPVLFNRKQKWLKRRPAKQQATTAHTELIESLKSLGITASADVVEQTLTELYSDGREGVEQEEIVRRVFLHLQGR
jgi:hypothetical protein